MILYYLVIFSVFVVLQSLFINGVHDCFKGKKLVDGVTSKVDYQGMIFYMMAPSFFEKYRYKIWTKNLWGCVKCMSLPYGAITFFPVAIYLLGWHWEEIPIFVFDVFILVYLNFYFYKKV